MVECSSRLYITSTPPGIVKPESKLKHMLPLDLNTFQVWGLKFERDDVKSSDSSFFEKR